MTDKMVTKMKKNTTPSLRETKLAGKKLFITRESVLADLGLYSSVLLAFAERLDNFTKRLKAGESISYEERIWNDSKIRNIPFEINGQPVEIVFFGNNPNYILSMDKPIESENCKAELYTEFKKVVPLHSLLLRDDNGYDLDTGLSYIKYRLCYYAEKRSFFGGVKFELVKDFYGENLI